MKKIAVVLLMLFYLPCLIYSQATTSSNSLKLISISEVGMLPVVGENEAVNISPLINTAVGIQIDNVFSVGLGTGVKFVSIGFQEKIVYPHIPVVLDFRLLMSKEKHIPFFVLRAGYAFTTYTKLPTDYPEYDTVWGGLVFEGGLGYRYQITEKLGLNLSLGYQGQQNQFSSPKISGYVHQLAVKLGFHILGKEKL